MLSINKNEVIEGSSVSHTDATPLPSEDQAIDIDYTAGPSSKRPKIQRSIKNSFEEIVSNTSTTGDKARKINNTILYFNYKDNQLFSLVDDEGFKHLLKETAPYYNIPSTSTTTWLLDEKYDVLSTLLKSKICSVEHVTLTSDIWSDMQMRSFLDVTALVELGTEFQSVTLGFYHLDQRHTSEYIAAVPSRNCPKSREKENTKSTRQTKLYKYWLSNRFSRLTEESEKQTMEIPDDSTKKERKPPPICTTGVENINFLIALLDAEIAGKCSIKE
ncbi:unnamed protein product [Diabrotica balteata]|uniref:Uncharacterized protein n=1 Tax=Diabrotica balteata TaxID=107213 RepID=A0A9N9X877_DIABA|nr:unnamed protein product [Diabrotica balteata]